MGVVYLPTWKPWKKTKHPWIGKYTFPSRGSLGKFSKLLRSFISVYFALYLWLHLGLPPQQSILVAVIPSFAMAAARHWFGKGHFFCGGGERGLRVWWNQWNRRCSSNLVGMIVCFFVQICDDGVQIIVVHVCWWEVSNFFTCQFVSTVLNGLNKQVLFLFEHVALRCWMRLYHMSLSQDFFDM